MGPLDESVRTVQEGTVMGLTGKFCCRINKDKFTTRHGNTKTIFIIFHIVKCVFIEKSSQLVKEVRDQGDQIGSFSKYDPEYNLKPHSARTRPKLVGPRGGCRY